MSMVRLALMNVRHGMKNYLSLVLSLAFTVLVLFNFQNLIDSETFAVLGSRNKEYIEMIVQMISFILGCFMFFFIGYATNVFLTRRKKEIGIYLFMGLSHEKIGKLYLLETVFIGLSALLLGLFFGAISAGLFQMILLLMSDLHVEIRFQPGWKPAVVTAVIYGAVYMIFAVKGYISLVKSSIHSMLSAAKQNEYVRQKSGTLWTKAFLGIMVLASGYGLALKEERAGAMGNALGAVVLVTVGVYLLFGGLIPLIVQKMAGNKRFLYRKQRVLWVNSLVFRMKKNYRTYAMVSILLLCSVTALATSFAMKGRYDNIVRFENTYTFQLLSTRKDLGEQTKKVIEERTELAVYTQIPVLVIDSSVLNANDFYQKHAVVPYSALQQLAREAELPFDLPELEDHQIIKLSHLYLMSLITDRSEVMVTIQEKAYRQIEDISIPYLGYLQESVSFYLVNDREYENLLPLGQEQYTYNYRIRHPEDFAQTRDALDQFVGSLGDDGIARVAIDPESNELDWVKVMYSMGMFMFFVFVVASGSIMFMKFYNDAFAERERVRVLMKMGIAWEDLQKSVMTELAAAYGIPFVVMGISSFFSVGALAKMMFVDLTGVNVVSVGIVFGILVLWYGGSVRAYTLLNAELLS